MTKYNSVNVLTQQYHQTGQSTKNNALGMREMQARAFAQRNSQYLLIKSPPASGKSRAMMFIALDKLINQGIRKVVITVPEMSIGRSFSSLSLTKQGFFADWEVDSRYNLCTQLAESDARKTAIFKEFITKTSQPNEPFQILICTHHSFRFGFEKFVDEQLDIALFNDVLVCVDEFHHVAAHESNRLGSIIENIMTNTTAHVVAMTGSYFRGDSVPILTPEDEEKFDKVTYTYYEQLNGYEYLQSLGLGYHFYKKSFFEALQKTLDPSLKTIIHIPNVNSLAAETDKYETVGQIIDVIGVVDSIDENTGVVAVIAHSGQKLLIADLVTDDKVRPKTQEYLNGIERREQMDIIIALGMAKEGFDWEYCEHVLTIGYRSSLTEVVQIIGRSTRDSKGKSHAQFTNLIAQPDASKGEVASSVNILLKAITLSLLMEQVLKPNIRFKRRTDINSTNSGELTTGTIVIDDSYNRPSDKVMQILNQDKEEILATICQNPSTIKDYLAAEENDIEPEAVTNKVLPKIIRTKYASLNDVEVLQLQEAFMQYVAINHHGGVVDKKYIPDDAVIEGERQYIKKDDAYIDVTNSSVTEVNPLEYTIIKGRHLPDGAKIISEAGGSAAVDQNTANSGFVRVGTKFINVNNLPIELVASVNPFHDAYEVLSKNLDKATLNTINDTIQSRHSTVTEQEAVIMWPKIAEFKRMTGREPILTSNDPIERRMAEVVKYVRYQKAKRAVSNA